ncbi:hypothetical protein B0H13DRAFT_2358862 [Mycena leptocephala]|nr:hypothetical protein B0H13DRAFT_2358862 [Mycena leptocephala]
MEGPDTPHGYSWVAFILGLICDSEFRLAEEVCRDMAYQLCQAVAYMHSVGISHRNLHTNNILLTKDDPLFIKVSAGLIGTNRPTCMNASAHDPLGRTSTSHRRPSSPSRQTTAPTCAPTVGASGLLLLKSAWRKLRHSYNSVARLRWDDDSSRRRPFFAEDGTLTVHGMSTVEYARLLNEAHDGHCSDNGITLSAEGRPLAQRRLLGQIARRSWKTRLLRDNPATRLSIRDALAHPWLKNHKPVYPDVVDVDSKARL